jgi:hypothetical protein
MNIADLSFGKGSRMCIGKNLGMMQVYKLVATLVATFKLRQADTEKEWTVINGWFSRQEGFEVKMSSRRYLAGGCYCTNTWVWQSISFMSENTLLKT